MATYSAQQLEKMSLLEVRKVAREVGITDLAGKRPAELARAILTKQKPGGVDPRVKPKEAAAAKAKVNKTAPEPEPEVEETDEAPAKPAPKTTLTIEQRVARIEAALLRAGVLDPNKPEKVMQTKTPQSVEQAVLPAEWFGKDGSLRLTAEAIESMNFDSIMAVNNLLAERELPHADITEELRSKVRLARMRLVMVLRKMGAVTKAKPKEDEESDAGDEGGAPFPPQAPGDKCMVHWGTEDDEWCVGTLVRVFKQRGKPVYEMEYFDPAEKEDTQGEFPASEIKALGE